MRRWLQATLAQRARHRRQPRVPDARASSWRARWTPTSASAADDLDAATLHWRLYAALSRRARHARAGDGAAAPPTCRRARTNPTPRRRGRWPASSPPPSRTTRPGAATGCWRWDAGADADDPQAILWRRVATGRPHRARRIQDYLARFGDGDRARRPGCRAAVRVRHAQRLAGRAARAGDAGAGRHRCTSTCRPRRRHTGATCRSLGARLRAGEADPFGDARTARNPLLRPGARPAATSWPCSAATRSCIPSVEIAAYDDPADARGYADGGLRDACCTACRRDLLHRRAPPSVRVARRAAPRRSQPAGACLPHAPARTAGAARPAARAAGGPALRSRRCSRARSRCWRPTSIPTCRISRPCSAPCTAARTSSRTRWPTPARWRASRWPRCSCACWRCRSSRFGLDEVLDLLASPPLAEAAGLDAAAASTACTTGCRPPARAGASMPRIAQRHGAPDDDAYTWQFALDRLLLGHASGATRCTSRRACRALAGPRRRRAGRARRAAAPAARAGALRARCSARRCRPRSGANACSRCSRRCCPSRRRPPAANARWTACVRWSTTSPMPRAQRRLPRPLPAEVVRAHFARALARGRHPRAAAHRRRQLRRAWCRCACCRSARSACSA